MLAHEYLIRSASAYPQRLAVVEPSAAATYAELEELSNGVRDLLVARGIQNGARVSLYLRKSIDSVAVIFGILKAGAAYVPLDPSAPAARNALILKDCDVQHLFIEQALLAPLLRELSPADGEAGITVLEGAGGGTPLRQALERERPPRGFPGAVSKEDLAYILYTSGSTGRPKGVCLSHWAAVSFVDWCTELLDPVPQDRFSSHAPFHFDLSILDLYVPIKSGASIVLIGEESGKDPQRLAGLISDQRITVWYSTPSVLTLLLQFGKLEECCLSSLRAVMFAGEVFPIKHFKALQQILGAARLINLYGPTETNVCTFYESTGEIPETRTEPLPIGKACSHLKTKVVDSSGRTVTAGEEGELCVRGPAVMEGYWNRPELNRKAFLQDAEGNRWYRTGDVVVEQRDGNYQFLGRRDRMVKKRGYRIELGEIETGLYRHPEILEAAVVAQSDEDDGIKLKAFVTFRGPGRPSMIDLKRFCAENLPLYMAPDHFSFQDALPKTSTDKIDYQKLASID